MPGHAGARSLPTASHRAHRPAPALAPLALQADPALLALMHQLIAAKLNVAAGAAAPAAVAAAIQSADDLIGARSVTCTPALIGTATQHCTIVGVGTTYVRLPSASGLIATLDRFNNGCVDDPLTPADECAGIPLHCTPVEERQRMLAACFAAKPACANEALDEAGRTACCLAL